MTILRLHKLIHKAILALTCAAALAIAAPVAISAQSAPFSTDYTLQRNINPPQAQRQSRDGRRYDIRQVAQNNVSPSQAKSIAMNAVPGSKYLDLRIDGQGYRVWLVNDGRRIEVYVDARTGKYQIVKS